jgi:hypothetical protein
MEQQNHGFANHAEEKYQPASCNICGSFLYPTDHGNQEITFHCSSVEARFWDFDRGTMDQLNAKEHWDKSRVEKFYKISVKSKQL